jgi:hypothetical protein
MGVEWEHGESSTALGDQRNEGKCPLSVEFSRGGFVRKQPANGRISHI